MNGWYINRFQVWKVAIIIIIIISKWNEEGLPYKIISVPKCSISSRVLTVKGPWQLSEYNDITLEDLIIGSESKFYNWLKEYDGKKGASIGLWDQSSMNCMHWSAYVLKFSRYISIPSLMNQIIRKHKTILSRVKLEPLKKLNLPRNHKVKLIMQQRGFETPPPPHKKNIYIYIKRRFIPLNFLDALSKVISHTIISLI